MKILCECDTAEEAKFFNSVVTSGILNLPENMKEHINNQIKQNVVDKDIHIDFYIRDGWEGNIIAIPCELHEVVDVIFSHNNVIALWIEDESDKHYSNCLWKGMAHSIPEEFKNYRFKSILGIGSEILDDSHIINIVIQKPEEDAY